MIAPPTPDELATWPVTIDVPAAGRCFGLGREASYRAAAAGELPGAIRVGRRWRVVTSRLIEFLGVEPPDNGEDSPGPTGRASPPTEQSADHRREQRRGEGSLRAIVPVEDTRPSS